MMQEEDGATFATRCCFSSPEKLEGRRRKIRCLIRAMKERYYGKKKKKEKKVVLSPPLSDSGSLGSPKPLSASCMVTSSMSCYIHLTAT